MTVVVVALAATAVEAVVRSEQRAARDELELHATVAATRVEEHLEAQVSTATERAIELLAGETVTDTQLRTVLTGLGYTVGGVLDGDGRLLTILPPRPELVGHDFSDELEHITIASRQRRPGVSQAIVSPAIQTPVVALALPYPSPEGRRILSLVGELGQAVLDEVLDDVSALGGVEATVIDRDGNLIATTTGPLPGEIVPLSRWDPRVAALIETGSRGEHEDRGGHERSLATAPIGDTGWRLLVSADTRDLFAAAVRERRAANGSVVVLALLGLAVSLLVARQRHGRWVAEEELRDLNVTLQDRVAQRTRELEAALATARAGERTALQLVAVVDAAGEAIIGEDADGIITSWNPAARRLYGYSAAEAIGRPTEDLLTSADQDDQPSELLARALASGRVVRAEAVRRSRDGYERHVLISTAPIVASDGSVTGAVGIHQDLTSLHDAERAEREAQAMFASVFRDGAAPQGVTDLMGRFVRVNGALCELLGYTADELLDMTVGEVTLPDDRDATRAYMREFTEGTRSSIQLLKRYLHRDGHVVTTVATLNCVADDDGTPTWIVGMLQDITEQMEDQQQLAQREAMLRGLTAAVGNITTMYDTSGRCVFAAGAGLAELGATPEQLVGTFFVDRHADDPVAMDGFARALRGEDVDDVATYGDRVYDMRLRAVRSDDEVTHVVAAVTDITERERAQETIAASERRFRALVRHTREAICQVDTDGTVVYISPGIEEVVGVAPEDLVGSDVLDLIYAEDLPAARRALASLATPGAEQEGRLRLVHVDGGLRAVEYHVTNLTHEPAVGSLAGTFRDVTERAEAERARAAHAEELERLNHDLTTAIQVRNHILDATSHELRTPLTPVLGMLEVLRTQWPQLDDAARHGYLEVIDRNAGRIATLVEDLLFASRIRAGALPAAPEPVRVATRLQHAEARWPEVGPLMVGGEIDVDVWCQPDHLDQMLNTLLSNAATYGGPPYEIEVSTSGAAVRIAISDHGPGVPEHILPRVFEPFVQGTSGDRRTAHGLGLGLHIARTLARANGGDLYHDVSVTGTRFVLSLLAVPVHGRADEHAEPTEMT